MNKFKELIERIKGNNKTVKNIFISFFALVLIAGILLTTYRSSLYIDAGDAHPNNSNVSSVGFVLEAEDKVIISLMPSKFRYTEDTPLPEQGIIITDKDGKNTQMITQEYGSSLAYSNGWLFFANIFDSNKLYKVKLDGSEKQLALDKSVDNLIAEEDWLYFHDSLNFKIGRISVNDTTKVENLIDEVYVTDVNISGDRLYYINGTSTREIWSAKKDGSDIRKMADIGDGYNLVVHGGYMYYIGDGNLNRIKINSDNPEIVIADSEVSKYVVTDDCIWFLSGANRYIFKYDFESNTSEVTAVSDCYEVGIAFGTAYGIGYDLIFQVTEEGYNQFGRYSSLNN